MFLTTIPGIFEGVYGERVGIAGLHYFALGVGLTGASQINARFMDRIYMYYTKKNGGKGRPEYRLREYFSLYLLSISVVAFYFHRFVTVLHDKVVLIITLTLTLVPCSIDGSRDDLPPDGPLHHWLDRPSTHTLDRARYREFTFPYPVSLV